MAQCLPLKSMVCSWSWCLLIWIFFFFFFLEWAQNLGYNMALWIIFHLLFEFLFSKFFLFSFFRKLFPLFFIKKKKSSLEKKKFTEDFFFNSFPWKFSFAKNFFSWIFFFLQKNFFWNFHFLKKLFTKDYFFKKLFFFSWISFFLCNSLARTYCGPPLKDYESLIILGLGIQQGGPGLGKFILTL